LAAGESTYILPIDGDSDSAVKLADWTVKYDVTQNPEPLFFRGLVNARFGNLSKAKTDSDLILKLEPNNPSYQALAAYIAVLRGDKPQPPSLTHRTIKDGRALDLLGETAYLRGDPADAQKWWAEAADVYPLGGSLAYWTGKKHLARGQRRIAAALLTECSAVAPSSKEAKEAKEILATMQAP
jgi:tetratricopeptide (TPR) repeat protein